MFSFISPSRRSYVENGPIYYPFGGNLSRNVLKDYKGPQNREIKILFLGCYDLRNVLNTVASKSNDGLLTIHVNHPCPLSFARNVLILKVILAPSFDVSNLHDLNYLWDVWYNVTWSKNTLNRFVKDVRDLIMDGLSENCFGLGSKEVDSLKDIYKSWLSSLSKTLTSPSHINKILKSRLNFITGCGGEIGLGVFFLQETGINRRIVTGNFDKLTKGREARMTSESCPELLKKKLSNEFKDYFETGSCNSTKLLKHAAINPTLLEPKTLRWRIDGSSCPFDGYLPLSLSELETTYKEGIATRFCQKKLKSFVAAFRQLKKGSVKFHFHLEEDLYFCNFGTSEKFDVIDCSSLADDLGLANLISSSNQRLRCCLNALLLTESILWCGFASSVVQYVEESLCTPLSMIPTLYGVRLAEHHHIESTSKKDKEALPINLSWHKSHRFENVPFGCSPSLERCLKKLEKKCFFMEGSSSSWLKKKICPLNKFLTPQTLDCVVTHLAEQAGKQEGNCRKKFFQSELPPQFSLAQTTLDAWANRRPIVVVTGGQLFSPVLSRLFNEQKLMLQGPMLRLVLAPFNLYLERSMKKRQSAGLSNNFTPKMEDDLRKSAGLPSSFSFEPPQMAGSDFGDRSINWAAELPQVHYIDNFFLNFDKNEDGSFRSVRVAFLLPKEQDFVKTHCAALVEIASGTQMLFVGLLKDLRQIDMDDPRLTARQFSPPSEEIPRGPHMRAVNCQESENEFIVDISIQTKDDPKGLNISSDQQFPFEAAHRITFTLAQPEGVKPLTLSFPFPVLVDCIDATLRRSDRSIRVVLRKALKGGEGFNLTKQTEMQNEKIPAFEKKHDIPSPNICGGCKNVSNVQMKRCSKCKVVHYCSVKCQAADWQNHKLICSFF